MVRKYICPECGKEFESKYKRKFCSRSCAAKYNNKNRKPRSLESRKKVSDSLKKYHGNKNSPIYQNQICENCGKSIPLNFIKRRFCCNKCSGEYHHNQLVKRWLENPMKFNKIKHQFIKRYLMELHNNKCEICGWGELNQFSKTIPLEVHHIDGDCTNNHPNNLQLLCPNCHSLTENYGARNKGKSKRFKK